ncbi:MAG: hypothetical protein P1U68_11415, partial [Verrucomicrobiales bacterium]|nr:hypothetical protein [Verrucomicrobiales bacterium]
MVNKPMSDKASGNGAEKRDPEEKSDLPSGPEGKEIPVDPTAGDLLDPVERWWNEEIVEEQEGRRNRKVDSVSKEDSDPDFVEKPRVVPLQAIRPLTPILAEI